MRHVARIVACLALVWGSGGGATLESPASRACGAVEAGELFGPAEAAALAAPAGTSGTIQGTHAVHYDDPAALREAADVVFLGRFVSIAGSGPAPGSGTASTVFVFEPEVALKGLLSECVLVRQYGGSMNGVLFRDVTDAEVRVGERSLVFLSAEDEGARWVLGGPQGRFVVLDGHAWSVDLVNPDLTWLRYKVAGLPLEDLLAETHA